MTYKIFLDDELEAPDNSWAVARTSQEAKELVINNGSPDVISFDSNLGLDEINNRLDTGFEFAQWLVEKDKTCRFLRDDFKFITHSTNLLEARSIVEFLSYYLGVQRSL